MLQKRKDQESEQEGSSLDKIKEKFSKQKEEVVNTEIVNPETRVVRLIVHMDQFCGCGGKEDVEVDRTVPWDSPLKDGESVDGLDDSDEVIGYVK